MKRVAWSCLLGMTLLLAVGRGAVPRVDRTITVHPGESIQGAITGALEGEVIALAPGTYRESFVIDRSLTLCGAAEGTVIEGASRGAVVRICGDGVVVRLADLTVQGGRGWEGHGIQVEDSAVVEMTNVTVTRNNWSGIWATDRSVLFLDKCRITENGTHGLFTWDFARVSVQRCAIVGNRTHGVLALHLSELTLTECVISGNHSGIWTWDGVRLYAVKSRIVENTSGGLAAQNGSLLHLAECSVSDNGGMGLWLSDSSRGVVQRCEISTNGEDGILLERDAILESYDSVLRENRGVGIRAATASCVGGFDPSAPFKGWVKGRGNDIPGPGEDGGNAEAALCPDYPGSLWPAGFLRAGGSG